MLSKKNKCSLCQSDGVTSITCPYNYNSKHPCSQSHYNVLHGGALLSSPETTVPTKTGTLTSLQTDSSTRQVKSVSKTVDEPEPKSKTTSDEPSVPSPQPVAPKRSRSPQPISSADFTERIALTFGDAGENHAGMEMVGTLGKKGSGFTLEELEKMNEYFSQTYKTEHSVFEWEDEKASVLIIRQYVKPSEHNSIYDEMNTFAWDTKYWDTRRGQVLNKIARSNVVILDDISQEPDYINKKGRIIDGNTLSNFSAVKRRLIHDITTAISNDKGNNLICEGNRYYDLKKCGIGYHGDVERRKVIALSLGASSKINWVWFKNSKALREPYSFTINGGDIYIMNEKAVGYDWKKRSRITLRHAAGACKYLSLKGRMKDEEQLVSSPINLSTSSSDSDTKIESDTLLQTPKSQSLELDSNIQRDDLTIYMNKPSLPVVQFYSRSANKDNIGCSIPDWRRRLSTMYIPDNPIIIDGKKWNSIEGWFQANKFIYDDGRYSEYVEHFTYDGKFSDPKLSRRAGGKVWSKKYGVILHPNWEDSKINVMIKGIQSRIEQALDIQKILKTIKGKYSLLHYDNPRGRGISYWGGIYKELEDDSGKQIMGKNILGKIYMFLSNQLQILDNGIDITKSTDELYTTFLSIIKEVYIQEQTPVVTPSKPSIVTTGSLKELTQPKEEGPQKEDDESEKEDDEPEKEEDEPEKEQDEPEKEEDEPEKEEDIKTSTKTKTQPHVCDEPLVFDKLLDNDVTSEEAYTMIDEMITIMDTYHTYVQTNYKKMLSKKRFVSKFKFRLRDKQFNVVPHIYMTIDNNGIIYTCDMYNRCKSETSDTMIEQKVYSIQVRIPKSINPQESLEEIEHNISDSFIHIQLKTLLHKINILNYIDIESKDKEDLTISYRKQFEQLKNEYDDILRLKEYILKNDSANRSINMNYTLDFIKKVLSLKFSIYYHYKDSQYDSILYNRDTKTEKTLELVYGNNLDKLKEDFTNKDDIFRIEHIIKILDTYKNRDKKEYDTSFESVDKQDIILQLMVNEFWNIRHKESIFTHRQIDMDQLYNIKIFGDPDKTKYLNTHINYIAPILVNTKKTEIYDTLIIYYHSKDERVGDNIREHISPDTLSTYQILNTTSHWRRSLSNECATPFVVDSLQFKSIEHFLQYSKFSNRDDIDNEVIRRKYQQFANYFSMSFNSIYAHITGEQAYTMGSAEHTYVYNITISDDWLDQRPKYLMKGLYAKYAQNKDIEKSLLATQQAILLSPFKGKRRKHKYRLNKELMNVRDILYSNSEPDDYSNYKNDITIFNTITHTHNQMLHTLHLSNTSTTNMGYDVDEDEIEEEVEEGMEKDVVIEADTTTVDPGTTQTTQISEGDSSVTTNTDKIDAIKQAILKHIHDRFNTLHDILIHNQDISVILAGNKDYKDNTDGLYIESSIDPHYIGARGHNLGVGAAFNQWLELYQGSSENGREHYTYVLQRIDALVNKLFTTFNIEGKEDRIQCDQISSEQASDTTFIVWGANVINWNTDIGTDIGSDPRWSGQAKHIGKQKMGVYGIVTTPLGLNEDNMDEIFTDDKSHIDIIVDSQSDGGAAATKDSTSTEDLELEELDKEEDEAYEEQEEHYERSTKHDVFLSKFRTEKAQQDFQSALTELEQGKKEGHWIWSTFPQAPFGTTSRSLDLSFENKEQVLYFIMDDGLRTQLILLLDTLLRYRSENPGKKLSTIMDQDTSKPFTDELKLYSSLTLFDEIAKKTHNDWLGDWPEGSDRSEHIHKGIRDTKEIMDKIQEFKESFAEFTPSHLVLELLRDLSDTDPFKPVIDQMKKDSEGSAMGSLFGGHRSHNPNQSSHIQPPSNLDMGSLSNIEHLHNLVGGSIDNSILKIALQNNNNNVYRSLASLTNGKTLGIYKMLSNQTT